MNRTILLRTKKGAKKKNNNIKLHKMHAMMTCKEQEKAFKNLEKYQWKPKFINQNTINPNLKLKQKKNQDNKSKLKHT